MIVKPLLDISELRKSVSRVYAARTSHEPAIGFHCV
jgi:hypothetical protein